METYDPFDLGDMEEAVDLIIDHIKKQEKIFVYGDYDADGITSSALLYDLFSIFKSEPSVYMPDRVKEGYGLNKKAIDKIVKEGGALIITVDTGIKNKEEVEYAQKKGLKVIITDHHVPPTKKSEYPPCLIINPAIKEEKYPFKKLAGVGVAYKLAQALIIKSTLTEKQKIALNENLLDLVAVGTVADCVDLIGENRILVKKGLEVLNKTKRIGFKELIKVSGLKGYLDSWNIGFQLAPRINASSRVAHAAKAFHLLISKDRVKAKERALDLNEKNSLRQKITEEVMEGAMEQAREEKGKIIITVSKKENPWMEGVIGLAAGRISNVFYKPVLVLTHSEGKLKGSGRSVEEFNIMEALQESDEFLINYGGHPSACGFSLEVGNLEKFRKKISQYSNKKLEKIKLVPKIKIDEEIDIERVNDSFLKNIEKLAPFGEANPKPVFLSRKVCVKDIVCMGKNKEHIKFRFNGLWGVFFRQADNCDSIKIGDLLDIVYYVDINDFNGRRSVQLKIIDIEVS